MSRPLSATLRALAVPELVLEIVSHLGQADLAQAVLVSREWRTMAERKLYRKPNLGYYYDDNGEKHFMRMEQLSRSVFGRAELAELVRTVELLVVDNEGPSGADQHRIQLATKLFYSCKNLSSVSLAGDGGTSLRQLMPAVAVYASQITCLKLNKFIFIDLEPDTVDFSLSVFGPYLAAFANLKTLQLLDFELTPTQPSDWPQPSFQLESLSLSIAPGPDYLPLQPSDLAWFTSSSRHSLRHLSLEGHGQDALAEVAEWGASLRTLKLSLGSEEMREQVEVLVRLARMGGLEQLKLFSGWGHGAGLRTAAAEVNRRVGREVAVVD